MQLLCTLIQAKSRMVGTAVHAVFSTGLQHMLKRLLCFRVAFSLRARRLRKATNYFLISLNSIQMFA